MSIHQQHEGRLLQGSLPLLYWKYWNMVDQMKNWRTTGIWLRWVLVLFVVGAMVGVYSSANAEKVNSKPVDTARTSPGQTLNPEVNRSTDLQGIKEQLKQLEDKERQGYILVLEGQRKTIDWWFSFLAVVTAVLAVFGALIPFLMGRKDKEIIEEDKKQIGIAMLEVEKDRQEVSRLVESIKGHQKTAENTAKELADIKDKAKEELTTFKSAQQMETSAALKTQEAVKTVQQDPALDPSPGLRAIAIKASQAKQARRANKLWGALAEVQPEDALVHFNAGYWTHELAEQTKDMEQIFWLREAGVRYAQALRLKPDMHEAANNWGNALDAEAQAVAGGDLTEARRLWQEAGTKYAQALQLKPDFHEAADEWGSVLLSEAGALPPQECEQISLLFNRAESILREHANHAPGVVAYNLACVYGRRGDVTRCLEWLKTCETHHVLPDCQHLKTDRDLDDAVRAAPEFVTWLSSVCPENEGG